MTDLTQNISRLHRIRREARPERVTIGGKEFERDDVCARRFGSTTRTLGRGDKNGAPYIYLNGVKYRPVDDYDAYVLTGIQQRQPPKRRRR